MREWKNRVFLVHLLFKLFWHLCVRMETSKKSLDFQSILVVPLCIHSHKFWQISSVLKKQCASVYQWMGVYHVESSTSWKVPRGKLLQSLQDSNNTRIILVLISFFSLSWRTYDILLHYFSNWENCENIVIDSHLT